MKIKTKDKSEGFKPITLEITFETLAELKYYWNALNIADGPLSDKSKLSHYPMEVCEIPNDELWEEINGALENL